MASDHLTATYKGLIKTLENAPELADVLVKVWPMYPFMYQGYHVKTGCLTLSVVPADTSGEEPVHNEPTKTDVIATDFILTCDTKFGKDEDVFFNETAPTMLDLEYMVIRALQSQAFWNAQGHHMGWSVDTIERDVLVETPRGEADPDVRRFIISLTVDVLLDRDDGPSR